MKTERERIKWIDSLKGIAIIGIFMIHSVGWTGIINNENHPLLHQIVIKGVWGVEITYMINAYFCAKESLKYKNASWKQSTRLLFKKILRILPLYYFSMLLIAVYQLMNGSFSGITVGNIISHILFFNVVNPYWWNSFLPGSGYVGVLVLMWVLYSFYGRKVDNLEKAVCGAGILYIVSMILLKLAGSWCPISNQTIWAAWSGYIVRGIQSFSLGTVLYYLPDFRKKKMEHPKLFSWSVTLAILLSFYIRLGSMSNYVFMMLCILLIVANQIYGTFIIVNPVFEFLGRHTFGIFLGHIVLYYFLKDLIANQKLLFAALAVGAVVVAVAAEYFIEKPVQKFIKKRTLLNDRS